MSENRRRWTEEEIERLVSFVEINYGFLTSKINPRKSKKDVDDKWKEAAMSINSLAGGLPFTVIQVKKKWADLKSLAKKAVAAWDKQSRATGGGSNNASQPTEQQYRICRIIGPVSTAGVPDTDDLDTDDIPAPSAQLALVPVVAPTPEATSSRSELVYSSSSSNVENTPPRRPHKSKREERDEEILSVERSLVAKVDQLHLALLNTNAIMGEMLAEMKRSNAIHEGMAGSSTPTLHRPQIDDALFQELHYNDDQ